MNLSLPDLPRPGVMEVMDVMDDLDVMDGIVAACAVICAVGAARLLRGMVKRG